MTEQDEREDLIQWVSSHITPHELDVRAWLGRTLRGNNDVDDVIQEVYCRLSELTDHRHIRSGRAYFFAVARSIVIHHARRNNIVKFEAMANEDMFDWEDETPSPERVVGARMQLQRVLAAIASLPPAYRDVVEARRIHGLSQKEAAQYLGVTEKVIENNSSRGLHLIMKILSDDQVKSPDSNKNSRDESSVHAFY